MSIPKNKTSILALLSIMVMNFNLCYATFQQPDKLKYKGKKLDLMTGWGHPSPLELYYYTNEIKYPFIGYSSGNYRGNIAHWEIKQDKLYLKEIEVDKKFHEPKEYNVKSKSNKEHQNNKVLADWYSGVIECEYRIKKYHELKFTYLILIKNGEVIKVEKLNGYGNGISVDNNEMVKINYNYITFYYQTTCDKITINEKKGVLDCNKYKNSPIFDYYGNEITDWKYTWDNLEKSGAPSSEWQINNDSLYLTSLELKYGLRFDTVYSEKLDLTEEFNNVANTNKVFANWVNGIHLVNFKIKETQKPKYMIMKISNGVITEKHIIEEELDFKEMPKNIDPKIKTLIEKYLNC